MKLYHKARVIHDVVGCAFLVEYKKQWISPWKSHWMHHQTIGYAESSGTYPYRTKEQALLHATNSVNQIMTEVVVYEVSNSQ